MGARSTTTGQPTITSTDGATCTVTLVRHDGPSNRVRARTNTTTTIISTLRMVNLTLSRLHQMTFTVIISHSGRLANLITSHGRRQVTNGASHIISTITRRNHSRFTIRRARQTRQVGLMNNRSTTANRRVLVHNRLHLSRIIRFIMDQLRKRLVSTRLMRPRRLRGRTIRINRFGLSGTLLLTLLLVQRTHRPLTINLRRRHRKILRIIRNKNGRHKGVRDLFDIIRSPGTLLHDF